MNLSPQPNYVLIDGVLRPGAIASLYQRGEPLEIEPLYLGTRWAQLHNLGPILVSPRGPSSLISETYQDVVVQADACLLYSGAPMQVVADHLRRFINPPDVQGINGLLRFADPLVARYWLGSYQAEHRDAVLGPVDAWYVPENPHTWESAPTLQWTTFAHTAPPAKWVDTHAQLGQAQLEALDQAARWRFMERLHKSLEQHYPHLLCRLDNPIRTQWFDERLNEAQAWGLASERSLAIWVEYSLRWGDGFALRPSEPFEQWLARTPNALKLAPELRIQQMDNDCLDIETNKEV